MRIRLSGSSILLRTSFQVHFGLCCCQVTVHTSDVPDAGTTARVYMELNGTSNSSSPKELSNPVSSSSSSHKQQPFQRRQADCFILKCFDLGEVQRLTIWHDGSGSKPSWNLAYVEVQHMPNGPVRWYGGTMAEMTACIACTDPGLACSATRPAVGHRRDFQAVWQ